MSLSNEHIINTVGAFNLISCISFIRKVWNVFMLQKITRTNSVQSHDFLTYATVFFPYNYITISFQQLTVLRILKNNDFRISLKLIRINITILPI